ASCGRNWVSMPSASGAWSGCGNTRACGSLKTHRYIEYRSMPSKYFWCLILVRAQVSAILPMYMYLRNTKINSSLARAATYRELRKTVTSIDLPRWIVDTPLLASCQRAFRDEQRRHQAADQGSAEDRAAAIAQGHSRQRRFHAARVRRHGPQGR